MRNSYEQEHNRAAIEARKIARDAEVDAERVVAEALTGEAKQEGIRQQGVIYGGLIGVAVLMVQPFLSVTALDAPATISIIAFAVAIPLLAALVLVNAQEAFRRRITSSVLVGITKSIAQLAAFVGLVAGFWHITWIAGVTFLVLGFLAMGVHSAGFWRVESATVVDGTHSV